MREQSKRERRLGHNEAYNRKEGGIRMSIYKQMEEFLLEIHQVGDLIPLPQRVQDYLNVRREAISNATMRGKDSPDHLSWKHYATLLHSNTDIADLVAW